MEQKKVRVAITQGDTNGVGYELIFKTFAEPEMLELCTPIIYGSPKAAAYHRKALELQTNFSIISSADEAKEGRINLLAAYDDETKIDFGLATPESGQAALKALDRAMSDYRDDAYDVLVTAPLNCGNIEGQGFQFRGNAAYIETSLGEGAKTMPLHVCQDIRLAFVTENMAIKDVAAAISQDKIVDCASTLYTTVKRDFCISNPRIAILSLNPSTGDHVFGAEEETVIIPAIDALVEKGVQAFGPYAADDFFGKGYYEQFDAVLAMYSDQGMAPFRAVAPEGSVVFNAALPLVCTESDSTVNYTDAGKNILSADSFRNAVYLAIDAFRSREAYDAPMANPLKKLYHEKRDETEKVRFAIPKKHSGSPFPPKSPKQSKEHSAPAAQPTAAQADSPAIQ